MKNLPNFLEPIAHIIAYTDDTYVSISGQSVDEVKSPLENTMTLHDNYLNLIGMKTNVSKTEMIYFSRKPLEDPFKFISRAVPAPPTRSPDPGVPLTPKP